MYSPPFAHFTYLWGQANQIIIIRIPRDIIKSSPRTQHEKGYAMNAAADLSAAAFNKKKRR